jgi:hypothetical protein
MGFCFQEYLIASPEQEEERGYLGMQEAPPGLLKLRQDQIHGSTCPTSPALGGMAI